MLHKENIGEAVKNITTEIPWNEIAKRRDVLTHHYFGVDNRVLWDTLNDDFDKFERVINEILIKMGNKTSKKFPEIVGTNKAIL